MLKPTKEQRQVAVKIAARYTKDCTAQVGLLMPCYSSSMGPCNDCRRRSNLGREIAQALAAQALEEACGAEFFDDWICDLPAQHLGHHGGISCGRWAKMNIDEPPLDRGVNAADGCVVVQSPAPVQGVALTELKKHAAELVAIFDGKKSPNERLVTALNGLEDALEALAVEAKP